MFDSLPNQFDYMLGLSLHYERFFVGSKRATTTCSARTVPVAEHEHIDNGIRYFIFNFFYV